MSQKENLSQNFVGNREIIKDKVKQLLDEDVTDEEQIQHFVEIMKLVSHCQDFNEGHITFLDTLWNRSRDIIHNRRKTERHFDRDSKTIHLDLETELLYKEMRAELLKIVDARVQQNNHILRNSSIRYTEWKENCT